MEPGWDNLLLNSFDPHSKAHDLGPKCFYDQLKLSREQMYKMWDIEEKFHDRTRKTRYELFYKRMEMEDAFANPRISETKLIEKQKEIDTLMQKMNDEMTKFRLDQRKVLTAEQIKRLGEMRFPKGL